MSYATLAQAKRALAAENVSTTDDAALYELLIQVTDRINALEWLDGVGFEPIHDVVQWIMRPWQIDSYHDGSMALPKPLLEYDNMTINDTAVPASTAGVDGHDPPYRRLYLSDSMLNSGRTWYDVVNVCNVYRLKVRVTGRWGYRTRYADDAWQLSGDSVQDAGGIDVSVTTVTVADADGADWRQLTPRFSPGQLIRIEDEYLRIDAVDTATNELTVRRGVNGTTAAAHANGTAIDTYTPDDRIVRGVARQAGLMYARRGAYDISQSDAMGGQTIYPQDLLAGLRGVLQEYANAWP